MIDTVRLETMIGERVAALRTLRGVSARDMSLSIGQGETYIHNIENHKALPSIRGFFYICEYLNISPKDFFDMDASNPEKLNGLIDDLKALNSRQLINLAELVKDLKR